MADTNITIPELGSLTAGQLNDLLLVTRGTTGYKMLVSDIAKTIIETYAGSSLAGSAQSVKAALDSLNSSSAELELIDITSSLNQVRISGKTGILSISGTPTTDITAFTGNRIKLPSGFRPFTNENFYIATNIDGNVVVSQWQVLTDGNVRCGTLLPANKNFQISIPYAL